MTTPIAPVAWLPEAAPVAATAPIASTEPVAATDFLGLLKTGASNLAEQSGQANDMLAAYATGENVSPHELVMAMEQARMSLQLAVEVRNRVVDAYQELTRLQI